MLGEKEQINPRSLAEGAKEQDKTLRSVALKAFTSLFSHHLHITLSSKRKKKKQTNHPTNLQTPPKQSHLTGTLAFQTSAAAFTLHITPGAPWLHRFGLCIPYTTATKPQLPLRPDFPVLVHHDITTQPLAQAENTQTRWSKGRPSRCSLCSSESANICSTSQAWLQETAV